MPLYDSVVMASADCLTLLVGLAPCDCTAWRKFHYSTGPIIRNWRSGSAWVSCCVTNVKHSYFFPIVAPAAKSISQFLKLLSLAFLKVFLMDGPVL